MSSTSGGRAPHPGTRRASPEAPWRARRRRGPCGFRAQVGRRSLPLRLERERRVGSPVPRHGARHVVVRQHPGRRGIDRSVRGQGRFDRLPQACRLPRAGQKVEVESRVHLIRAQVPRESPGVGEPHLADQHARLVVAVRDRAPAAIDVVELVAVHERVVPVAVLELELGKHGVLHEERRRVDPDACDASVEPEAEDLLVLGPDVGMGPVEIGLLGREQVQIPLAVVHPRPRGAAEDRLPAVGRGRAVWTGSRPEPEPLPGRRGRRRCKRLAEPGVLVRNVIRHEVDDRPHPELAGLCDQRLGVLERAECRVDRAIVDDVVARVSERRRIPRVEPERVHAERP